MDEKVLALLERSGIYSPLARPCPVTIEIKGARGYRFFIPDCFLRDHSNGFEVGVKMLLRRYVQAWAKIVAKEDGNFSWEQHSENVIGLLDGYDWLELYQKIKDGTRKCELPVRVNGSKLKIRRLGDILAFDLENLAQNRKEHTRGLKAILSLCRAQESQNNQGVHELLGKVRGIFSLYGILEGRDLDLEKLFLQIDKHFAMESLEFGSEGLVEAYCQNQGIAIGRFCGFEMFAKLVHARANDSMSDPIWRRGNVIDLDCSSRYGFARNDDLWLELAIKTSLPEGVFEDIDPEAQIHDEQVDFACAAALFVNQVCSMQQERRIQTLREFNP